MLLCFQGIGTQITNVIASQTADDQIPGIRKQVEALRHGNCREWSGYSVIINHSVLSLRILSQTEIYGIIKGIFKKAPVVFEGGAVR